MKIISRELSEKFAAIIYDNMHPKETIQSKGLYYNIFGKVYMELASQIDDTTVRTHNKLPI